MKKSIFTVMAFAALLVCGNVDAKKKEIGVQVYSVRTVMNAGNYQDTHKSTFKELAKEGYTFLEAASYSDGKFYGVSPEQYKADAEAYGLKTLSSHTSKNLTKDEYNAGKIINSLDWWKEAIPAHKAAGMEYIVIPSGAPNSSIADLDLYCHYLNEVGKLCKENGIKFGYHNHSGEFKKIGETVIYQYMLEHTDPEYVFFEMDVYWAVMGQAAPVVYFQNYPGRFTLLHIKDVEVIGASGMVNFDAIFQNAKVAGVERIVVEVERFSGRWQDTMGASAKYLQKTKYVKY